MNQSDICPSGCPIFFLTLIERVVHTQHTSIHFGLMIRMTDSLLLSPFDSKDRNQSCYQGLSVQG